MSSLQAYPCQGHLLRDICCNSLGFGSIENSIQTKICNQRPLPLLIVCFKIFFTILSWQSIIIFSKIQMLAKIFPKFVISRVIQNSYLAENATVDLLKIPLGLHESHLRFEEPGDYFTVRFFGYLSTLTPPDNFANKYEQKAYEEACERFKVFNQTSAVYEKLSDLQREAHQLYNYVERNNSSSNIFSQSLQTSKQFELDVIDGIGRYTELETALESTPEWQTKVREEIGNWYHLIHNNLAESESKRKVFNKLNRQEYFV